MPSMSISRSDRRNRVVGAQVAAVGHEGLVAGVGQTGDAIAIGAAEGQVGGGVLIVERVVEQDAGVGNGRAGGTRATSPRQTRRRPSRFATAAAPPASRR